VVTLTPRPLYPRRKSPQNPLDRKLDGSHNRSGRRGEEKILTLPGLEFRPLSRPARSQSLHRLLLPARRCLNNFRFPYHKSALALEMPETNSCCRISAGSQETLRLAMLSPSTCFRFGSSSRRGLYDVSWHHLTDGSELLHFN
jgi:hypothetical protein